MHPQRPAIVAGFSATCTPNARFRARSRMSRGGPRVVHARFLFQHEKDFLARIERFLR
jgi:hypothetical protein